METICLINSYLNYSNNYVYTFKFNNKYGPLAQLVEQFPFKEWVDGSSPSRLTISYATGGYLIIISFNQVCIFLILLSDEG